MQFPVEIYPVIFKYLDEDIESSIRLSRVCKYFYSILSISSRHLCLTEDGIDFRFFLMHKAKILLAASSAQLGIDLLEAKWIPFKYLQWLNSKGECDEIISAATVTPEYLEDRFNTFDEKFEKTRLPKLNELEMESLLYHAPSNWPEWALYEYMPILERILEYYPTKGLSGVPSFRGFSRGMINLSFRIYRKYPDLINLDDMIILEDPNVSFDEVFNTILNECHDNQSILISKILRRDDATVEIVNKYIEYVNWNTIWDNPNLTTDFIHEHLNQIDWYVLGMRIDLSEDFLLKNLFNFQKSSWHEWNNLTEEMLIKLEEYGVNITWAIDSENISDDFFEQRINSLNWHRLCLYANNSRCAFLEKHSDKIVWKGLGSNSNISIRFKEKYMDYIEWKDITCSIFY